MPSLIPGTHGNFAVADLEDPEVPEKLVEIIAGELVSSLPPSRVHNRIAPEGAVTDFLLRKQFNPTKGSNPFQWMV